MKKIVLLIFTILSLTGFSTIALASNNPIDEEVQQEESTNHSETGDFVVEDANEDASEGEMSSAGEEILGAVTKKDKRIAELSNKYNDKTLGVFAYYLEMIRYYSTPVFFIFFTIGAFNFFIVGNKKLDKKEQGFGWITACIIGWVFFQCIPLIFTLLAL